MKNRIILTAIVAIFSFAGLSMGQSLTLGMPETTLGRLDNNVPLFAQATWGQGKTVKIDFVKTSRDTSQATVSYTGLESPGGQLFEAVFAASSHEACLANRDFSSAVPVGPERASLLYDFATDTGTLSWFFPRNDSANCRVLLVRNSVDTSDLGVWRTNFGQTYAPEQEAGKSDSRLAADAAPQRSRVTSVVVTFNQVVTLAPW